MQNAKHVQDNDEAFDIPEYLKTNADGGISPIKNKAKLKKDFTMEFIMAKAKSKKAMSNNYMDRPFTPPTVSKKPTVV